jgi:hypothetical protein
LHPFQMLAIQRGKQVDAGNQTFRVEIDVESRSRIDVLCTLELGRQIPVDLRSDQAPLEQGLVPPHFAVRRRMQQDSRFKRAQVIRVLTAQRIDFGLGLVEAILKHAIDKCFNPFTEDRTRAFGGVTGKPLDKQARHEQRLEALAKLIGEKAAHAKAPVKEIGGPEREREREGRFGGALVAKPSAAPRAFGKRLGVAHKRLDDSRRGRAAPEGFEHQHALLVSQRDQRHRDALALGEIDLRSRVGVVPSSPSLIRRERAGFRRWT